MKDLPDVTVDEITRRLVEEFKPDKIIMFGSTVWGGAREDSDLDLLVIVSESGLTPPQRAAKAYLCLKEIPAPRISSSLWSGRKLDKIAPGLP